MRWLVALSLYLTCSCARPATESNPGVTFGPIVFSSTRNGHSQLYSCNIDGSDLRPVSDSTTDDSGPRWSPSGDRIAFISGGMLTLFRCNSRQRESLGVKANGAWNWSPSGDQIACSCRDDLVLVDVRTRQVSKVGKDCLGASWMPNGRLLVSQEFVLRILEDGQPKPFLKGTPDQTVFPQIGGAWNRGPSSLCAFASVDKEDHGVVFVVDESGSQPRKIFTGHDACWPWDWSPDGKSLVVTAKETRSGKICGDVYIVRVEDGRVTKLTNDDAFAGGASWRP